MKKAFVVVAAIALAVLSSVAAFAGTYALEKTNVQFDLPDSWKQGDSNIGTSFTSPKGDMIIFFGEVDGKNGIEAALEAVDKIIGQVMTDVEMGDESETQINGIQVVEMEGKGKSDGADVFVNVSFLNAGGSNIGFVTSIGEKAAVEGNGKDLEALVKSFKIIK